MVAALDIDEDDKPEKRVHVDLLRIGTKHLSDFMTNKTHKFFDIPNSHQDFLNKLPGSWATECFVY